MVFGEYYDCIYEAHGNRGDDLENLKHPIDVPLGHYACFGEVYRAIRNSEYAEVTYKVYLYAENIPNKNYNLCNKNETKKILRCLQKTVDFSYKFEKGRYTVNSFGGDMVDFNVLVVKIKGNYAQHLWVTTMLRCFFEWPYNIAAKEACILQSEIREAEGFDFTKENWINLYLTIAAQLGSYSLHGIVGFRGLHPKAKTYHEWKQKLESIHGSPSIYDRLKQGGGIFSNDSKRIEIYDQHTLDEGTKSRASKYVAAYKDKLSWKK